MKKILGLLVCGLSLSVFAAENFDDKGIITRWTDSTNTTSGLGRAFITNTTPGTARLVIDEIEATTILGSPSSGAATFGILTVQTSLFSNGNTILGNATNDTVIAGAGSITASGHVVIARSLSVAGETNTAALVVGGPSALNATTIGGLAVTTNAAVGGTLGVSGVSTLNSASIGALTVTTNATVSGALDVTGIPTFAATSLVFSAAAAAVPTNVVVADGVGLRIRINQTNYFIRATLN